MTRTERKLIVDMLERMEDSAQASHVHYDRVTNRFIWNDEVWKAADPYGYRIAVRARAALAAADQSVA